MSRSVQPRATKAATSYFARRQPAAAATQKRAAQVRLERIEQIEIPRTKIPGRPWRPPNLKVAEVAVAIEDEHVDAVVQAIARQKVIVELGSLELVARNHFIDQGRAPARA